MSCSNTAFFEFEDCKSSYLFEVGLSPLGSYTYLITDKFGNVYEKEFTTDEDGYFSIFAIDFPSFLFTNVSGAFSLLIKENSGGCDTVDFEYNGETYDSISFSFKSSSDCNYIDDGGNVYERPCVEVIPDKCEKVRQCIGIDEDNGDEDKFLNEKGEFVEVTGGGAVESVTGEFVDNTDPLNPEIVGIQDELDLKVPYTGATSNVDLGLNKITADAVAFSLTPTNSPGQGQIAYQGNTGALAYIMDNSNVVCQIGQQLYAYVTNADNVTINKGEPVYLFGATGNRATVKRAYNTSDATSAKTLGLASENIASNQKGFIICQGVLDGLNTGSYTEGDTLYLGATAGSLTNTKPYAPNHLVYIGVVEKANNGAGQIYVRPQNGYELDEIHDVDLKSNPPVNNDILKYNSTSKLWVNSSISTLYSERRNDFQSPYSYCGSAPSNSSESTSVWTIYRIENFLGGTVATLSATGSWDNRTTLIYT